MLTLDTIINLMIFGSLILLQAPVKESVMAYLMHSDLIYMDLLQRECMCESIFVHGTVLILSKKADLMP